MKSTQDLIRHGVAQGVVEAHHQSEIKEHGVIKTILNDTLAVSRNILSGYAEPFTFFVASGVRHRRACRKRQLRLEP
jgi:hypothetical protein